MKLGQQHFTDKLPRARCNGARVKKSTLSRSANNIVLSADRAFAPADAAAAKLAVIAGSVLAAVVGTMVLRYRAVAVTPASS